MCKKNKYVIGLFIFTVFCYLTSPLLQFSINRTKRFVSGQHYFGGHPIHENIKNLPSVTVESGRTVYCRMDFCDFRFPLPKGAVVMSTNSVSGGFDTIKGSIYVTNVDGGTVNLQAYAKQIWKDGFSVNMGSDFLFTANSPDGGVLVVDTSGHATKIDFSFFGDY